MLYFHAHWSFQIWKKAFGDNPYQYWNVCRWDDTIIDSAGLIRVDRKILMTQSTYDLIPINAIAFPTMPRFTFWNGALLRYRIYPAIGGVVQDYFIEKTFAGLPWWVAVRRHEWEIV